MRYAYGTGESRALAIDFGDELPFPVSGDPIELRFHELYVFVASSVLF